MNELEWCAVCRIQHQEYTEPIAVAAMGSLATMKTEVRAYCRRHLGQIADVHQRHELYFSEEHVLVDEMLIRALPEQLLNELL